MKVAESLALATVLAIAGAAPTRAQSLIANGTFTANAAAFTNWPGYIGGSNPGTIPSWLIFGAGSSVGLNGAGTGATVGNPFGPTNPGGHTYAFIQSGQTLLGQYLTLAPNTQYKLDYDVAARAGNAAQYRVVIAPSDSTGFNGLYYDSGAQPGNNAAFTHITAWFITPATLGASPNIQLWNATGSGDNTIDYANVSLSPSGSAARKPKLFLFAGQSNMVGMGDWNSLTAGERAAVTNVFVFAADPNHAPPITTLAYYLYWVPPQGFFNNYATWSYSGMAWNAMNPSQYDFPNNFGPEFTTVRDLASALGEPIYFAKYALGGTGLDSSFASLYGTWYPYAADPGSPAEYTLSLYHSMLRWATNALLAARQSEPATELAGFFWLQGEADATSTIANSYNANLTDLLQRLRSDVGSSTLPVVIGRLANQAPSLMPYASTVRAAQAAVAAATTNAVLVDTDGLPMDATYHLHYTGEGLKTIGERFAQAWLNLNRPPSVANGSGASNVLITAATLTGGLIATGGVPTTVSIYWGPADGGTDTTAWSNRVSLGTLSASPFSAGITGLAAGSSYFYRCLAQNAFGATWANSTASFTTQAPGGADNDHDGLPDAWEIYYFGNTNAPNGGPGNDYDRDGTSNLAEYIAGTVPTNASSRLALALARTNNAVAMSFMALRAAGPGYEGMTRRYTLEASTNPAGGGWQALAGWSGVVGDDSNKTCTNQAAAQAAFYRLLVELK